MLLLVDGKRRRKRPTTTNKGLVWVLFLFFSPQEGDTAAITITISLTRTDGM